MKRSLVGVLFRLLGLLITIGLAGCGGTETGNPAGSGGGGPRDGNPAVEIGGVVCDKLTECFGEQEGFTKEYCVWALAVSETLGAALGVDEEPPPEYGQVIVKVENSGLSADEEAVARCVNAIGSLECDDPAVQAVDIEQGFTNIEQMIPEASCSEVFSVP